MTVQTTNKTWTESEIAALSSCDIAQLNYDEMQDLVRASRGNEADHVTESDVLVRLVYAVQRSCKDKIAAR